VGRPKGLKVSHYNIYRFELSEGFAVLFEVETRLIKRYIPPYIKFDLVEVERTDYVPLTGCTRQVAEMRVSYANI
jgi:hypothetical protein